MPSIIVVGYVSTGLKVRPYLSEDLLMPSTAVCGLGVVQSQGISDENDDKIGHFAIVTA